MQEENNEKKICPCCASSLEGRWEPISKGIAQSLIKFREAVLDKKENCVHLQKDVKLTKNQYNNFQKLRYHGLVAHAKDPETKEYITGYWLLTKRGNQFIKNQVEIPKKVLIFRNRIQDYFKQKVTIETVLKSDEPYYYKREDFEYQIVDIDVTDFELDKFDNIKFDENGQGKLF